MSSNWFRCDFERQIALYCQAIEVIRKRIDRDFSRDYLLGLRVVEACQAF